MDEGSKLHIMRINTCYCYCKRHGKIAKGYIATSRSACLYWECIENAYRLSEIDASCMGSSTARQSTFWCQSQSKSVAFVTCVRSTWLSPGHSGQHCWTPTRKDSKESTINETSKCKRVASSLRKRHVPQTRRGYSARSCPIPTDQQFKNCHAFIQEVPSHQRSVGHGRLLRRQGGKRSVPIHSSLNQYINTWESPMRV